MSVLNFQLDPDAGRRTSRRNDVPDPAALANAVRQAIEPAIHTAVREAVAPFADFAGPALSTEAAARYLGISPRSLETLVSAGELRPVRPTPGCRRFLRETLDAHLRACLR